MYERAAGKFFFSTCHFRGIRDDIEEEDEQVSEHPMFLIQYIADQRGFQTNHPLYTSKSYSAPLPLYLTVQVAYLESSRFKYFACIDYS